MGLIYKVIEDDKEQTYDGFSLCVVGGWETDFCKLDNRPEEAKFLAIFQWEDSINLFWLENDGLALDELGRYLRSLHGLETKIHVFQQVKTGSSII